MSCACCSQCSYISTPQSEVGVNQSVVKAFRAFTVLFDMKNVERVEPANPPLNMPVYFMTRYEGLAPTRLQRLRSLRFFAQHRRTESSMQAIGGDKRGRLTNKRGSEVSVTGKCASSCITCKPLSTNYRGNVECGSRR